jgi:hypothetical protein
VRALLKMVWVAGSVQQSLKSKKGSEHFRVRVSSKPWKVRSIRSMDGLEVRLEYLAVNRNTVAHQSAVVTDIGRADHQDASAHSRAGGYGRMAERHWRRYRPACVAVLEREGRLAQELLQAEQRMLHALEQELRVRRAHDNVEHLSYLDRVRWENNVRSAIEERLLPEMILLPPEPGVA